MELIGIADLSADLSYRKLCDLEKFSGFFHAVLDQKFLRGLTEGVTENFAEVTAVQIAAACHILNSDCTGIILRDKSHRFICIILCAFAALGAPSGGRTADQRVHDEKKMSDQMIGRFLRVCGKMQEFIFQPYAILRSASKIDRRS